MSVFTEMPQEYCEISSTVPVLLNFQFSEDAFKSSCLENQDAYKFLRRLNERSFDLSPPKKKKRETIFRLKMNA